MGRVCLSGPIDRLADWQQGILAEALSFYKCLDNVILNGKTKVYGNRSDSIRYPQGVQIVVRSTDDEMLVIYHAFEDDLQDLEIEIPVGYRVSKSFYGDKISIVGNKIAIRGLKPFTAGAVLLKK